MFNFNLKKQRLWEIRSLSCGVLSTLWKCYVQQLRMYSTRARTQDLVVCTYPEKYLFVL